MLSEENLPELLRKALQAKREEEERDGMLSGGNALYIYIYSACIPPLSWGVTSCACSYQQDWSSDLKPCQP